MIQDDAGTEKVVVDADEVRQLWVQYHTDPLFPQSKSLLLQTRGHKYDILKLHFVHRDKKGVLLHLCLK